MASLAASTKDIFLSFPGKLIVISQTAKPRCFESKVFRLSSENGTDTEHAKFKDNETLGAVCCAVSKSGKYAVTCYQKNVTLWETVSWNITGVRQLSRSASCVCFSEREDFVVVADKSGDVYTYQVNGEEALGPGQLILGHVSMLLKVVVAPDDKHVATCDRDEKIRISRFPNAYNVTSYCLGHTESVTCLSFLSNRTEELISGSSDGTVRLWNYIRGKQLLVHNLNRDEQNVTVVGLNSIAIDDNTDLVCVIAHMINDIRLLTINHSGSSPQCLFIKSVPLPYSPRSLISVDKSLYVLSYDSPYFVTAYDCVGSDLIPNEQLNDYLTSTIPSYEDDFSTICRNVPEEKLLSYFNKRKIDDSQEYHRRKKERLLGQIDKNKVDKV